MLLLVPFLHDYNINSNFHHRFPSLKMDRLRLSGAIGLQDDPNPTSVGLGKSSAYHYLLAWYMIQSWAW